jgi:hypothetical protein
MKSYRKPAEVALLEQAATNLRDSLLIRRNAILGQKT